MNNNKKALILTTGRFIAVTPLSLPHKSLLQWFISLFNILLLSSLFFLVACEGKPALQYYGSKGFSAEIPLKVKGAHMIDTRIDGAARVIFEYGDFSRIEIIAMVEALPPVNPYGAMASGQLMSRQILKYISPSRKVSTDGVPEERYSKGPIKPVTVLFDEDAIEKYQGEAQITKTWLPRNERYTFNTQRFQFTRQGIVYTVIFDLELQEQHIEGLIPHILDSLQFTPPPQN